jgi:hypothetical protein
MLAGDPRRRRVSIAVRTGVQCPRHQAVNESFMGLQFMWLTFITLRGHRAVDPHATATSIRSYFEIVSLVGLLFNRPHSDCPSKHGSAC